MWGMVIGLIVGAAIAWSQALWRGKRPKKRSRAIPKGTAKEKAPRRPRKAKAEQGEPLPLDVAP